MPTIMRAAVGGFDLAGVLENHTGARSSMGDSSAC